MVTLTACHVDLGDVGAHGLRRLGRFVAFTTVAALGEVRPVPEIVKRKSRPRAARKGNRLILLDVTGSAIGEALVRLTSLRGRSRLRRLSRRVRLVRVAAKAF